MQVRTSNGILPIFPALNTIYVLGSRDAKMKDVITALAEHLI